MSSKRQDLDSVFTTGDHLTLLQLLTRRAISERRAGKRAPTVDDSGSRPTPDEAPAPSHDSAAAWRLVPADLTLHDWQRQALPIWLARGRGTVKVATGGGKTLFALAAAQTLQNEREHDLRLVIVVPTIPLMFQWRDELGRGDLPPSAIGLMGGGQETPPLSGVRVLICVLNSARERLPDLVQRADWSRRMLLVVDECHRAAATQARRIFEVKPRYTLGLSATPEPDLEIRDMPTDAAYEEGVVGQALGPIIYDFTLQQSLKASLLTPFEVWHVGLPLEPSEALEHAQVSREITDLRKTLQVRHRRSRSRQSFLAWCQTQAGRGGPPGAEAELFIGLANKRKRLLYRARARVEISLTILSESLADRDGRAIVFHESIEEIEHLFLRALDQGIPAVLEHSQLPDSVRADNIEAFRLGVARVIISAKSLVEGFNVPSADLGIVVASSSSVRQRIQSLGRMLRRKPGDRSARVLVLYVRDTEDEAIYEKADWESVIGAERNRYFFWRPAVEGASLAMGLEEVAGPPRTYRPPSWEVNVAGLSVGSPYPGQAHGQDARVDQDQNLRTDDGTIVRGPRAFVEAIVEYNVHRRARITPAGHLIVRADPEGAGGVADWRFVGQVDTEAVPASEAGVRLRLQTVSGRRVIARDDETQKGAVHFALGPGASRTPEAGQASERLLEWVRQEEARLGRPAKYLWWDRGTDYWLEAAGQRLPHPGPLAPLEFGG